MQQFESFRSWAALDVNTMTNLFLYGTRETPPDLNDRIRPHDAPEIVGTMAMNGVMSNGHGRYAKAALAPFVSDLFEGELDHLSGTYTVAELGRPGERRHDFARRSFLLIQPFLVIRGSCG